MKGDTIMKKFVLISIILIINILSISIFANENVVEVYDINNDVINNLRATKSFTITVRNPSGVALNNIYVSMRDNYSIPTQQNGYTNSSGQITFTMYDNRTYGFNVYNRDGACTFSPNTYTTSTPSTGLIFTINEYSSVYPTYSNPVSGSLSSYYGYRYLSGLDLHLGLDISASLGTSIYSATNAEYLGHGYDSSRGYWVSFDTNNSIYDVLYQHMQYGFDTSIEEATAGSTVIGYVGSTGYSSGNHLHIEFGRNLSFTASSVLDPLHFIY